MLMLGLALTGCALCIKFPGTPDVPDYWLRWSGLMAEHGMSGGYTIAYSDYPPGAFAFLFLTSRAAAWLHLSNFLLLKINITLCALLGTLAFGLWSRNLLQTAGFLFALTLNSAAHGYLDVVGLPLFLLSLWALERKRLALASCCFTMAAAIKWQPLIIAPFFLVHALDLRPASLLQPRVWLGAVGRLTAGALPVIAAVMLCFKPAAICQGLDKALHFHTALSYQGLNMNWVWQLLVHQQQGLSGVALFEVVPPPALALSMKLLFVAAYGFLLLTQFCRGHDFIDFLWFAALGYLSYCTLNPGVHENHLFLVMVLAFAVLGRRAGGSLPFAVFASLAANLNLFLFYGLDGRSPPGFAGFTAVTVVLSLINTAVTFGGLWWAGRQLCRDKQPRGHRSFQPEAP